MAVPSSNPSAYVDIDAPNVVARITFWNSGDYHAEVLSKGTGDNIYASLGHFESNVSLDDEFAEFFESLNQARK
ncbi:hypothetical protein EYV96_10710 [Dyella terrae]|uniref:Uncharacterized protein n=3 Tax=Rhodanobacteraceae TaxID=1775411 RepID=A0A4R0YTR8_9GAMM|nr:MULTISPECIES: hypothetical protein [Dyella]TBR40597.1 hypothetical protein EYV96_10710 [Dyella terrae]TCI11821.1 hypothetical protein EZM97_00160 [Dyella soli]